MQSTHIYVNFISCSTRQSHTVRSLKTKHEAVGDNRPHAVTVSSMCCVRSRAAEAEGQGSFPPAQAILDSWYFYYTGSLWFWSYKSDESASEVNSNRAPRPSTKWRHVSKGSDLSHWKVWWVVHLLVLQLKPWCRLHPTETPFRHGRGAIVSLKYAQHIVCKAGGFKADAETLPWDVALLCIAAIKF